MRFINPTEVSINAWGGNPIHLRARLFGTKSKNVFYMFQVFMRRLWGFLRNPEVLLTCLACSCLPHRGDGFRQATDSRVFSAACPQKLHGLPRCPDSWLHKQTSFVW